MASKIGTTGISSAGRPSGTFAAGCPVVSIAPRTVRRVRVNLLDDQAPLPGEAELLYHHLKNRLAELFEDIA